MGNYPKEQVYGIILIFNTIIIQANPKCFVEYQWKDRK